MGRPARHVFAYGAGGELDSGFEADFVRNALFSPRDVVLGHLSDECLNLHRNRRTTSCSRLPSPEKSEALSVPANECVGLDDDDGLPPIEQEGERCHGEPGRLVREAARTLLTFQKQG